MKYFHFIVDILCELGNMICTKTKNNFSKKKGTKAKVIQYNFYVYIFST